MICQCDLLFHHTYWRRFANDDTVIPGIDFSLQHNIWLPREDCWGVSAFLLLPKNIKVSQDSWKVRAAMNINNRFDRVRLRARRLTCSVLMAKIKSDRSTQVGYAPSREFTRSCLMWPLPLINGNENQIYLSEQQQAPLPELCITSAPLSLSRGAP